ncbi:Arm DNA-binding domain-containing protein [uncultured Bilophila sp.]
MGAIGACALRSSLTPLTDIRIKTATPAEEIYKIYDADRVVEMPPSGSKRWRFKYRFDGKEERISLGSYPHISTIFWFLQTHEASNVLNKELEAFCVPAKGSSTGRYNLGGFLRG